MAILHKEYSTFYGEIRITKARRESLEGNREAIKKKIKNWFSENKPKELPPKFWGQGSFEMKTIINPIPKKDDNDNTILEYDLDYGVYFIEKENENNKRSITTWHDWVYSSVKYHTNTLPEKKNTCIRVIYDDGHHIDLPIYYKDGKSIELAHKTKGWTTSDPKEFYEWFNNQAKNDQQLRRIVRYLKAWKNYRENNNSYLQLPSGFALTILATENFCSSDDDDKAFRDTVQKIKNSLDLSFICLRPTTPRGEDLFANYSETKKNDFLTSLDQLITACNKAKDEKNFKKASEYLRKQFGERFPLGADESEKDKSKALASSLLGSGAIPPRPYGYDL
ncbi:MAG: hypothetical protein D3903_06840 [Candidatus Electrothrix sp. GM3_4]|nr:hypothetical protein [Candidatus Electrothrix sp. GM3_4]